MTRLGLFGRGRLGTLIAAQGGERIAWQLGRGGIPPGPVELAIDVSAAEAVEAHLAWALESGTDLVIGATGWEIGDLEARVGRRIGVLVAPNFSLSVALMARFATVLARYAALEEGRDLFVLEHHHRLKADAPSGTARRLAAALMQGDPRKKEWTLGPAAPHQLSLGVLRAGHEPGLHTVGMDAPSETLELTHRARSRQLFADGALRAADWLRGRKGVFQMDDLAKELLDPLFHFGA